MKQPKLITPSALITGAILIAITALITLGLMGLTQLTGGYAAPQMVGEQELGLWGRITWPIALHLATVALALILGPFILWRKKGDKTHRALGRIWAVLMLVTAIVSAFIRAPGGGIMGTGYSPIHIFTLWTLINVPLGVWLARKGHVRQHRGVMTGLYIGLWVAGAFTLIPGRIIGTLVFG